MQDLAAISFQSMLGLQLRACMAIAGGKPGCSPLGGPQVASARLPVVPHRRPSLPCCLSPGPQLLRDPPPPPRSSTPQAHLPLRLRTHVVSQPLSMVTQSHRPPYHLCFVYHLLRRGSALEEHMLAALPPRCLQPSVLPADGLAKASVVPASQPCFCVQRSKPEDCQDCSPSAMAVVSS